MALHWRVLPHSDPHCLRPARRQALPPHTVTPHGSRAGRGSAARAFRRTVGGQVVAAAPWTAKPMRDIIQRRKSGTPHGGLERRCNRPVDRRKGSLVTDQRVASPATEGGRSCAAPRRTTWKAEGCSKLPLASPFPPRAVPSAALISKLIKRVGWRACAWCRGMPCHWQEAK